MNASALVELDGSFGEGGGQILRTSLALALVTGKGFRLHNVRARRSKPGLQPQHLMSVKAAAAIGHAGLRGASKGSSELEFTPAGITAGNYHFAIGTAGATGLVLHTIYVPLALAGSPSVITIDGGTHVSTSPCFHFLDVTWRRYMELVGLKIALHMRRPGFYPRGGGLLEATVQPAARLRGLGSLTPEPATTVGGISAVAGLPEHIARRQAQRAAHRLRDLGLRVHITEESWPDGPGTMIALILNTVPVPTLFFALGERGRPAERVADEAVAQVIRFHEAGPAVDSHSADQLVLPLALAEGPSSFPVAEVTSHLMTNVAVIQRFVERGIEVEGEEGKPGRVKIL